MLRIEKQEQGNKNHPAGANGADKCQTTVDMTQQFAGFPNQEEFQIETPKGRFFVGASLCGAPFFSY